MAASGPTRSTVKPVTATMIAAARASPSKSRLTQNQTAAERALKTAKPGSVEFRKALRDEILNTKELSGVHAVYNFKPGAYHGVDERALVIVRLNNGAWTYEP